MSLETISAREMDKYLEESNIKIIDIRDHYEYIRGHIPNSINIPYQDYDEIYEVINKDEVCILYCARGNLSLFLGRDLSSEGFHIKSLYGGLNQYRGVLVR